MSHSPPKTTRCGRTPLKSSWRPSFFAPRPGLLCFPALAGALFALTALGADQPAASGPLVVQIKRKPADPWQDAPTRTLDSLPAEVTAKIDTGLDQYGGLPSHAAGATGFFYATMLNGRWWLIDPEGGLFIDKAMVAVSPLHTPSAEEAWKTKFGHEKHWADQTVALLQAAGFNGTGAWSDNALLRREPHPLTYTTIVNFMGDYGKKRGGTYQQPGHLGYPKDCIFVFDPAFATFCDEEAQKLDATKDDPWMLGTFSDNELPWRRECLANYLALPPDDPGHKAAQEWLTGKHGSGAGLKDITEQDKEDFLGEVAERYYRLVSQAVKRRDPHHLYLGSRIDGRALGYPEVFTAAGPYTDVIAVNYYGAWTPEPAKLAMWTQRSGKPVLVTEWYAKAEDTGMGNTGGAGWIVKTQRDRGQFYQNFALGLLASKTCVGWQWFKYMDNDPADTAADPSNRDSNKGIVNVRYEPYEPLLKAMKALNERVYAVEDYLSRQ
jgi:hypothetical protein